MFDVNDNLTTSQNPEEDIFEVFRRAVANGQTRLALEALVPVLEVIIDIITPDEDEAQAPVESPKVEPAPEKKSEISENVSTENVVDKKKEKQTVKEPVQQKEQTSKD